MKITHFIAAITAALVLSACDSNSNSGNNADGTGTVGSYDSNSPYASSMGELAPGVGDRVFFATDSSALDSDAQGILSSQAAWLNQNSSVNITIEGHCDERGTREYNIALGERRAYSAKKYLVSQGISANRVSTVSYGKERPAVVGSDSGAWAQNRRSVTVVVQ